MNTQIIHNKGKILSEIHKTNLRKPKSEKGRENIAKANKRRGKNYNE